jgi:glucose-6-phosphate 1-dehydrogenase
MQILTLVAMEPPVKVAGENFSNYLRDAKVRVLQSMPPLSKQDVVIGQYVADNGKPGYLDDPTVPAGSITPTFCVAKMSINTPRWSGVPFIMKAGKALEERKAEIRIQFKDTPAANFLFDGLDIPRNELVIRLQPNEAIYLKTNIKGPGLQTNVEQSELDLSYQTRYADTYNPDAYTRLILDVLR